MHIDQEEIHNNKSFALTNVGFDLDKNKIIKNHGLPFMEVWNYMIRNSVYGNMKIGDKF